jgi:hypothetical protein
VSQDATRKPRQAAYGNNEAKDARHVGRMAWHRPQLMTRSLAKRLLLDAGRALAIFQAGR